MTTYIPADVTHIARGHWRAYVPFLDDFADEPPGAGARGVPHGRRESRTVVLHYYVARGVDLTEERGTA